LTIVRPVRFIAVGVANSLTGLSVIYLLIWLGGVSNFSANLLGYSTGLAVSYWLNSRWTFSFMGPMGRALPRFLMVVGAAYVTNLAAVAVAIYFFGINEYVGQAAGVVPYAVVSYFGMKKFVYGSGCVEPRRPHGP